MNHTLALLLCLTAFACEDATKGEQVAADTTNAAASMATPKAPPKPDNEKTVVNVAVGSANHTTLVTALKAADLVESLASPGGVYTVFAPTNAAFDKLPKGTVEGLLKPEKKAELKNILQHHAAVPILQIKDMHDGETLAMADGTKVTFHVKDGKVKVNDANIIASIPAMNGIVHVIDGVLSPPPK